MNIPVVFVYVVPSILYVNPAPVGAVTVIVPVDAIQSVCVVVTVGAAGIPTTITSICALGPSHVVDPSVWLT